MNPDEDPGMSQRERRRQQHQANKPKVRLNKSDLKKWTGPAIMLLLVGGVVAITVISDSTAEDCPGHWHAGYSVWLDGERVPFDPAVVPAWGSPDNTWAAGTHIHGDDGLYHFHPAIEKCIPMDDGLRNLDVDVSEDALVLGDNHGQRAGTYAEAPIRMFYQEWSEQDDTWQEVTDFSTVLDAQPGNGDSMVILYGNYTDEELDAILQAAPTVKGNANYDPHYNAPSN